MAAPYIPASDNAFDPFLLNFSGKVSAAPADYGLSSSDALEIRAASDRWHAAFMAASSPATRTRAAVLEKDQQRAAAVRVVRRFAGLIRANASVPDERKVGVGIRPVPRAHSPIHAPIERPVLAITGMRLAQHTLAVRGDAATARRGKPPGAIALLLFRTTADGPGSDPAAAQFVGLLTRSRFTSEFAAADGGKFATYFARWANAKGELGPWSMPVSMRVAA